MYSDTREAMDLLAAELVLGSLDQEQIRRAALQLESDDEFSALVGRWSDRMLPLATSLPAVAPDDDVWEQIEHRLNRLRHEETRESRSRGGAESRDSKWTFFSGWGLAATAATCAVVFAARIAVLDESDFAVATLDAENQPISWQVRLESRDGELTVKPNGQGRAAANSALELWLVTAEGSVKSLGLLPERSEAVLLLARSDVERLLAGATLAVSREPVGGSPTGQPTGPVIASGHLIMN